MSDNPPDIKVHVRRRQAPQFEELSPDVIDPSPLNPRKVVADDGIDDLAASLREQGQLQPIVVRPVGDRYELICGHRRHLAARRHRLPRLACIVRTMTDAEAV